MEIPTWPTQTIAVYPNRHYYLISLCVLVICSLFILGIDVFAVWAFWTNYHIDTGAYAAAIILIIGTILIGVFVWLFVISWPKWHPDNPFIMINSQGLCIEFRLRLGKVSIPWEEIEWIAARQVSMYTFLSISLRDSSHWWTIYGNGTPRKFRRDLATRAQLNIPQITLCMPARQILHLIEQNYAQELARYYVQLLPL